MRYQTAKLFITGASQAVRLPKQYRLPGSQVRVYREGRRVVLEPLDVWPDDFIATLGALDEPLDRYPELLISALAPKV